MNKAQLLHHIIETLQGRVRVLLQAARASHAEATDESTRSENKYDTRGLEASYLAEGQARQARELKDAIAVFESLESHDFAADEPIDLTAVVEVEAGGARSLYFMGPMCGGLELESPGGPLMVVTPASPLGKSLMGKQAGARWSVTLAGDSVPHRILSVR